MLQKSAKKHLLYFISVDNYFNKFVYKIFTKEFTKRFIFMRFCNKRLKIDKKGDRFWTLYVYILKNLRIQVKVETLKA